MSIWGLDLNHTLCPASQAAKWERGCAQVAKFCCKLTDSSFSSEEVDVGLTSQEALLLQIWEVVCERLVEDGHCLTKLVRKA